MPSPGVVTWNDSLNIWQVGHIRQRPFQDARVTKGSGSFTITLNAAATAETAVSFLVTN